MKKIKKNWIPACAGMTKAWDWAQTPVGDLVIALVGAAIGMPLAWLGIWALAAMGVW